MIGAKRAIQKYCDEDPSFEGSREHKLLVGLLQAIEEKNEETFKGLLYFLAITIRFDFNKITPFDKVKTKILTKVKELIISPVLDLAGGAGESLDLS